MMVDNKKGQGYLTLYVLGLTLLVLVRDIGGLNINKFIIVAFCALLFLLESVDEIVSSIMFTFPLLCGLPGNYIMTIGFATFMIKKRYFKKEQIFFLGFIILMEICASVFYPEKNFVEIVGYVVQAGIFFLLILEEDSCYSFEKAIKCCVLGITLVSVVIIVVTLKNAPSNWLALMANGSFRFGLVNSEYGNELRITLNANGFAYYSITGMSCIMVLIKNNPGKRIRELVEFFVLFCAGVLSFSRTWFLVFFIFVLVTYLSCSSNVIKAIKSTAVLVVSLFLVLSLFSRFLPDVMEGILSRFTDQNLQTAGRRTDIFGEYWRAFWNSGKSVIIGTGVTQYKEMLGVRDSIHNSMLQILVCYGVPGALLFCSGWFKSIVRHLGNVKLLYWIPFICIFCFSQSVQIVNPSNGLFPHLLSVMVLNYGAEKMLEGVNEREKMDYNG